MGVVFGCLSPSDVVVYLDGIVLRGGSSGYSVCKFN